MWKRLYPILIGMLLVVSAVGMPVAAATTINFNASAAQNPYIATDVTVSSFDRAQMDVGQYEADDGSIATLPATVNRSTDVDDIGTGHVNPYSFVASDIDFADRDEFPHDKSGVSAITNESEWTTFGANSSEISVADSSTANNVEALEIATNGNMASGDVAGAEFTNFSVTSDAQKRYIQAVLDISTLDSGAEVQLRVRDSDGDYVEATINSSQTASKESVIANATGEGLVYQRQIGSMTVQGSGDGTMSELQQVEIRVVDADATVTLSALNVEKTGKYQLGVKRVNTDSSDDFETETIYEVHSGGAINIHKLSTMGPAFDSAVIHGLTMPMNFRAQDLPAEKQRVNVSFMEATNYPSFNFKQDVYYRFKLPDAYDLSYANANLKQEVSLPNSRYQTVEVNEGADGTDFSDLDSWTSVLDSIGSVGTTSTLDSTIQPGQEIVVHEVVLLTTDEKNALQNVATGGAGQFQSGSGGFLNMLFSPLGALAAAVLGFLGLRRGS